MSSIFFFLSVFTISVIFGSVFTSEYNETVQLFNHTVVERKSNLTENQTLTEKCSKTLTEVEQELSSLKPVLEGQLTNNYKNISRALFPPRKQPSIYIKITIQFVNETGSRKTLSSSKAKKFTWSKSRNFVSVEYISLTAMTWMSLGTIWPTRRSASLVLTVRPLCAGAGKDNDFEDDDDMWKFILLQLQDIAIVPNVSDPRLNTAQIVVLGHEGDKDQPIDYPKDIEDRAKVWMILVSSILVALFGSWYTINYINNDTSETIKNTIICTSSFLNLGFFIISSLTLIMSVCEKEGKCWAFASTHFVFAVVSFIVLIFFCVYWFCKCKECMTKRKSSIFCIHWCWKCKECMGKDKFHYLLLPVVLPSWYFIVHHSLWVLCGGISSEPTWAVPLFLGECFVALIIICAIYVYYLNNTEKSEAKSKKPEQKGDKCLHFMHLVLGIVALISTIAVAVLSFVHHVGLATENILEVIIAAALVWLVKNSGIFSEKKDKATQSEAETQV